MGDRISPIIHVVADSRSSPQRYIVRCEAHGWRDVPEEDRLPQLKVWSVLGVSITVLSKEEAMAWMQQAEPGKIVDPSEVEGLTEEELRAARHIFAVDDGSGEWSQSGAEELQMRQATRQYEPWYFYNETWGALAFDYVPPP